MMATKTGISASHLLTRTRTASISDIDSENSRQQQESWKEGQWVSLV